MQYLISIPISQKLNNGESRYHFRNAVNGIIPQTIQQRFTKGILSSLWIQAVKNISKDDKYDFLLGSNSPIKGILNYKELSELLDFDIDIQMNDAARAQKIFSLISLSIWMQENNFTI
jgi:asparagine synthetase B (glutamine-hydrolysing)